jgi:hypothetical protein
MAHLFFANVRFPGIGCSPRLAYLTFSGFAAVIGAIPAHAALVSETSGKADVWVGNTYSQDSYSFNAQGLPLTKSATGAAATGSTGGSSSLSVQTGLIRASSTAQASSSGSRVAGEAYNSSANAFGTFLDSLTVNGLLPSGAAASGTGYIYGSIAVGGTLKATSGQSASASALLSYTLSVPGSTGESYVSNWTGQAVTYSLSGGVLRRSETDTVSGIPTLNVAASFQHSSSGPESISDFVTVRIPLVFGAASSFSFFGEASASTSISNPDIATSALAQADFNHTFQWLGTSKVTYVDASGVEQQLTNFSVNSASGTDYLSAVTSVPEPETYAMLLAGLGMVIGVAFRRNRQRW